MCDWILEFFLLCKTLNWSFSTWRTHFLLESKSKVTFALSTYYVLTHLDSGDVRVKKDEYLENKINYLGSKWHFWFSNCLSFFTWRFLKLFFIFLAHSAVCHTIHKDPNNKLQSFILPPCKHKNNQLKMLPSKVYSKVR